MADIKYIYDEQYYINYKYFLFLGNFVLITSTCPIGISCCKTMHHQPVLPFINVSIRSSNTHINEMVL